MTKAALLPLYLLSVPLMFLFLSFNCVAQDSFLNDVPAAFKNIPANPVVFYFTNEQIKIPPGGHLQGIQGWNSDGKEYAALTASSGTTSYYVTAEINSSSSSGKTIALQKLSDEPFRHAGGCQLADGKLAVGVEDNIIKDKSKVMLVDLADGKQQTVIDRKAVFKRSTAGAVGLMKMPNGQYLVVVADWDSRNLDFYLSNASRVPFDSVASYHVQDTAKWCSYQSVNLLIDSAGNIFMIGFCLEDTRNRADLFRLNDYKPELLSTRYFNCTKGNSFRYGAGIRISDNNELLLYSCARKLRKNNPVNVFGR